MLKRLFSILTISLILTGSFFSAYNTKYPVYADSTTDGWMNVTTNQQLADAFRYYCKSRDLTIEGSVADALTSFTTKAFNGLCNTLGIDITALQAEIKYKTGSNIGTQFLFTTSGIDAYNRIFSQFLQDNDLSVGDTVEDQTIYSGRWFVDADGNGCFEYIVKAYDPANIKAIGSTYRFTGEQLFRNNGSFTMNLLNGNSRTFSYSTTNPGNNSVNVQTKVGNSVIYQTYNNRIMEAGQLTILYFDSDASSSYRGQTYLANYITTHNYNNANYFELLWQLPSDYTYERNANIYITTNNNVINNNTYEGDTIINNNGDIINNNNPDPENPDIPDPNPGPTPDPPSIPDSGGWQDFSLPDMPNDWLIYGMEKKFPFDIPFNIMFGLSLLNHEPEIPKFEGDIDLKVCTWHYDIDLTPFDDIAAMLRRFEVLAFIIGLAMLTKELIMWG